MSKRIDVSLVAGRRPELIARTLKSFWNNMFVNFSVHKVIVNIDPVFGGARDELECIRVVREYFPCATIEMPDRPGFCKAVKNNWSKVESEFVFHLEDDWILNQEIGPDILDLFKEDRRIRQISLNNKEKHWCVASRGKFHVQTRRPKLFGRKIGLVHQFPVFTTSPSFLVRSFATGVSRRYDVNFDPEKQLYKNVNRPLERYIKRYVNLVIGDGPYYPITDIGREWRVGRGIDKMVVNGRSVWVGSIE